MEMEYLFSIAAASSIEYELLYDGRGREGQPTMCGLNRRGQAHRMCKRTTPGHHPLKDLIITVTVNQHQDSPENTPIITALGERTGTQQKRS